MMPTPPRLSAVLISFNGAFRLIEKTIRRLIRQTIVDQIELVIITPLVEDVSAHKESLQAFHSLRIVAGEMGTIAEAYARGVRHAGADLVVFCEDHCFPEPEWAAYLLAAHEKEWAAVGPAMCNANPGSPMSWASILIDYSEWLDPVESGVRSHIPGHNSCYKKSLLLEYGQDLERMLEAESILHWDLQKKGYQVYLEANAKTHHLNFEDFTSWVQVLFYASRRFAACRTEGWTWPKRLLYVLGSPLIPWIRLIRIVKQLRKPRHIPVNQFSVFLHLLAGLHVWGVGEFLGYAFKFGNSLAKATPFEFNRFQYLKKQPAEGRHR